VIIKAGSTDVTTYYDMRVSSTGLSATGLTPSDFDLQYTRSGAAAAAKVDAVVNPNGVGGDHSDNTVIEVDATSSPGLYRIDWPDAAFAAGVGETILSVKVATAFTEKKSVELSPQVDAATITATADGEAIPDAITALMAVLFGNNAPVSGANAFKKRDGSTTAVTVTNNATGTRTLSTIV